MPIFEKIRARAAAHRGRPEPQVAQGRGPATPALGSVMR